MGTVHDRQRVWSRRPGVRRLTAPISMSIKPRRASRGRTRAPAVAAQAAASWQGRCGGRATTTCFSSLDRRDDCGAASLVVPTSCLTTPDGIASNTCSHTTSRTSSPPRAVHAAVLQELDPHGDGQHEGDEPQGERTETAHAAWTPARHRRSHPSRVHPSIATSSALRRPPRTDAEGVASSYGATPCETTTVASDAAAAARRAQGCA